MGILQARISAAERLAGKQGVSESAIRSALAASRHVFSDSFQSIERQKASFIAELAHKARILRNHGMSETRTYWHDHLGFNYRMTNLQAAIGVAQLERIDEILKTKIALAQRYKDLLKDVPGVIQPPDVPGIKNVYWMYSIRLDEKFGMTAEALQKVLRENEIDSRPFFIPVHELPMYEEKGAYPVSTELSKTGLSLPSSPKLTHEDIDRITSVVRKATG